MSGESARSLGKGSTPGGLIGLYSMRFCPFPERMSLVRKTKGIRHEVININLMNKPEWFFMKNPFNLVPVLENSQSQLIHESAITCDIPGKKLPDDLYKTACQKMVFELFSKVPSLVGKEVCASLKEALHKEFREFSKLEVVLTNKITTLFDGSSISMIDYLTWPWFEQLESMKLNERVDHTPELKLWMAAMREDLRVSLYLQNSPEACDCGL
uniref:Glutathione S-transferase omega n=1 Tax=Saimiri boliviensis boliviensis TaxID=39432 RepID=A0A2K6T3J5_SAIBB